MNGVLEVWEVADRRAIAPWRVDRWVQDGQLPAVRVGERTLRFDSQEVQKYIERNTINMVAR